MRYLDTQWLCVHGVFTKRAATIRQISGTTNDGNSQEIVQNSGCHYTKQAEQKEHEKRGDTITLFKQRGCRYPERAGKEHFETASGSHTAESEAFTANGQQSAEWKRLGWSTLKPQAVATAEAEAFTANGGNKVPETVPKTEDGTTATSCPQAECDTIKVVSMRLKSAGRKALKQRCAGHKDESLDKVKWNQVKPKFQNELLFA